MNESLFFMIQLNYTFMNLWSSFRIPTY